MCSWISGDDLGNIRARIVIKSTLGLRCTAVASPPSRDTRMSWRRWPSPTPRRVPSSWSTWDKSPASMSMASPCAPDLQTRNVILKLLTLHCMTWGWTVFTTLQNHFENLYEYNWWMTWTTKMLLNLSSKPSLLTTYLHCLEIFLCKGEVCHLVTVSESNLDHNCQ